MWATLVSRHANHESAGTMPVERTEDALSMENLIHLVTLQGIALDRHPAYNAHRFRQHPEGSSERERLKSDFFGAKEYLKEESLKMLAAACREYDAICAIPSRHPDFVEPLAEAASETYPRAVDISSCFRKAGEAITTAAQDLRVDEASRVLLLDDVYATGRTYDRLSELLQAGGLSARPDIAVLVKVEKEAPWDQIVLAEKHSCTRSE